MKLWPIFTLVTLTFQHAFATNTNAPALNIAPAVEISFTADTNSVYQVQTSADAQHWTNAGPQIVGTGLPRSVLYSVRGQPKLFYRLQVVESGAIRTNLPTSLTGAIVDFDAAGGARENLTFATDKWVRSSLEETGTYEYSLDGDIGNLRVTFPSGTIYTLSLAFNSDAKSGTWTGNQFFDNGDHTVGPGATFKIQN